MKRIKNIVAALFVAVLLLTSVPSCSSNNFALKIGDTKISKEQYKVIAMSIKNNFLTQNNIEETDDMWDQFVDDTYSSTMKEYLDAMVQSYIIKYNVYSQHFDKLGLELDKEVVDKIEKTIKTIETQHGGKAALEKALKEQGYDYDQFIAQYYNEAKENAIIMHYFGPDSKINPTSRDDMKEYYNEYYSKVKHIFFSTRDEESNDYSKAEKEKIGARAKAVYDRVVAGEDFEKLLKEYNEDPGMTTSPDGYIFSTEDTSFVEIFHSTAFELKPGETKLIQSYMGYHIVKKYAFTDEDTFTAENEKMLIENMKSTENADLLDDLKEEIGVTYNNNVLEELSVVNLPRVTQEQSESDAIKEQIESIAGKDE